MTLSVERHCFYPCVIEQQPRCEQGSGHVREGRVVPRCFLSLSVPTQVMGARRRNRDMAFTIMTCSW